MKNRNAFMKLGQGIAIVALLAGCQVRMGTGQNANNPNGAQNNGNQPPAPPPAGGTPAPPPANNTPPQAEAKTKGGKLLVNAKVQFADGKADLLPAADAPLNSVLAYLQNHSNVTLLRIEGHTDSDGDEAANLKLSGARALAVVKWLEEKGIDRKRLVAVGFGEMMPVADNATADGKEKNRRTEFHIAQVNGRNFLNRDPMNGGTVFK